MTKNKPIVEGDALWELLTSGLYASLHDAIREVVSNSYDAGANNVKITIDSGAQLEKKKPKDIKIIIADDGVGMKEADFWEKYSSINSGPGGYNKATGRVRIGRFGVGAFALIPYSLEIHIYSRTKFGHSFKATIGSKKIDSKVLQIRKERWAKGKGKKLEDIISENFQVKDLKELTKTEIEEFEKIYSALGYKSGTMIECNGISHETREILLNGDKEISINNKEFQKNFLSDGQRQLAWKLSSTLPLPYKKTDKIAKKYEAELKSNNAPIRVTLNNIPLERSIYAGAQPIKDKIFNYKHKKINASGVIVESSGNVRPKQAQGVILRINNVAVGTYQFFDAVTHASASTRVTGEIHIKSGLDDALKPDRNNFKELQFEHLRKKIETELTASIKSAAKLRSIEKETKTNKKKKKLDELLDTDDSESDVFEVIPKTGISKKISKNVKVDKNTTNQEFIGEETPEEDVPVEETPKIDVPVEETPKVDAPIEEKLDNASKSQMKPELIDGSGKLNINHPIFKAPEGWYTSKFHKEAIEDIYKMALSVKLNETKEWDAFLKKLEKAHN